MDTTHITHARQTQLLIVTAIGDLLRDPAAKHAIMSTGDRAAILLLEGEVVASGHLLTAAYDVGMSLLVAEGHVRPAIDDRVAEAVATFQRDPFVSMGRLMDEAWRRAEAPPPANDVGAIQDRIDALVATYQRADAPRPAPSTSSAPTAVHFPSLATRPTEDPQA